jgi:transposase
LQKLGLTRKKKSKHAAERDTPEIQEERREFAEHVEPSEPKRLAFVDETGVTMAMTPSCGRAPKGERVEASAPASWESVMVIAAMGLDGVRASLAFPGVVDAAMFLMDVKQVLVPALPRGDVVIFDNLASHLRPSVSEAIEDAVASVSPLPPYRPDFNPTEEIFSKFKEFLGGSGPGSRSTSTTPLERDYERSSPRISWAGIATPERVSCKRDPQ